jgi:hypothetical protein
MACFCRLADAVMIIPWFRCLGNFTIPEEEAVGF